MAVPLIVAAFEAACLAADGVALAGLDFMVAQAVRMAIFRLGPRFATDTLVLGGVGVAAAAGSEVLVRAGRPTARGVEMVVKQLGRIMEAAPELQHGFRAARATGGHFYPSVDDGLCLTFAFVYKSVPRRFSMRITRHSDANQLRLFLRTCINGTRGQFHDPRQAWFRYHGYKSPSSSLPFSFLGRGQ